MRRIVRCAGSAQLLLITVILGVACSPESPPEPAAPSPQQTQPRPESTRPNVVWLMMDTLRAQSLSCYGYERPTSPTMDALAARGVLFENHISQGVWTMVSVPSIVTGLYFPTNVIENFDYRVIHRYPRSDQRSAPETFGANGYSTVMFTAHHMLVSEWTRFGRAFDEAYPVKDPAGRSPHGSASEVNDQFLDWLDKNDGQPFFAYLHLMDNHFPHTPEGKYAQWLVDDYDRDVFGPGGPVDTNQTFGPAEQAQMRGLYDGDVLFVDDQLKRLQEELAARGLLENTVFVITSDHGELLGENGRNWGHENYSEDEIVNVPWIMAGPGIPEGVRFQELTENVDVLPTLVQVLDMNHPEALDGLGMAAYWDPDGPKLQRDHVFARIPANRHYDYPSAFMVRNHEFKYVLNPETGEEQLWRLPDRAGQRENVLETNRAAADALRATLEQEFIPRYDAFLETEIHWILGRVGGGQSENWSPLDAVRRIDRGIVPPDVFEDNLWSSMPTFAGPNYLVSCGFKEDAPPVTLHYPIPNGRYHVSIELGKLIQLNDRGASMLVQAEGDTAAAPVRFEEDGDWAYRYGGTWQVDDRSFDVRLDECDRTHWAATRRFRMHPAPHATYSFPVEAMFEQSRGQFELELDPAEAIEVVGDESNRADVSRWSVVRNADVGETVLLAPSGEASLTASFTLPEGRYGLDISVDDSSEADAGLQVALRDETYPVSGFASATGMARGGVWNVTSGRLELTLSTVPGKPALRITGFHFYPVTESGEPVAPSMLTHIGMHPTDPEDDEAVTVDREALENLGYVH